MTLDPMPAGPDLLCAFDGVFEKYGFDIARYKPGFIKRRIERRMSLLDVRDHLEYSEILKKDRHEFEEFFMSLSINVTNFFRDGSVYEIFKSSIIPSIMSSSRRGESVRIWSAGCATGEEPYSIAMMFLEAMGTSMKANLEIFANDVSGKAIEYAQRGMYPVKSVEKLPRDIIQKYFRLARNGENIDFEIVPEVQKRISFRTGDILSNDERQMDAIFCRNVLIYYEKEAQELIIGKFSQSLKDSGYLVLGMDETMLGRRCETLFRPLMARERIYQKILRK